MSVIDTTLTQAVQALDKRILIIEDETMMVFLLNDMLENLGYNVAGTARRFDEATNMIEHESFDAAILDVNLNGQNTFELADMLLKQHLPFIFSSGYDPNSFPEPYRNCAALQKPYTQEQLSALLESLLNKEEEPLDLK